jgi:hypothetical protein
MKAIARVLVTAATLAVLTMLATTATAAASPLVDGPQLATSARATASQQAGWTCDSGHGPQVDCPRSDAPGGGVPAPADTTSSSASRVVVLVLAPIALAALVAAATWIGRRHRRLGEAV